MNLQLPINTLAWALGSVVMFYLSWRLLTSWRRSGNNFGLLFGNFSLLLAIALGLFSYPALFTRDLGILIAWSYVGDAFLYLGYLAMTYAVWYIYLKHKVRFGWLLVPGLVVAAVGWVDYVMHVEATLDAWLLFFRYPELGGAAHSIFLGGIGIPFGLLLIRQGFGEIGSRNWQAVAKSFAWGGMTIALCGFFVKFMYVDRGFVPVTASYFIIATHFSLFIALLLPASERKLQSSPEQIGNS